MSKSKKSNNLTAKYAFKYNKTAIFKDRKKALKKGEQKHKSRSIDRLFLSIKTQTLAV